MFHEIHWKGFDSRVCPGLIFVAANMIKTARGQRMQHTPPDPRCKRQCTSAPPPNVVQPALLSLKGRAGLGVRVYCLGSRVYRTGSRAQGLGLGFLRVMRGPRCSHCCRDISRCYPWRPYRLHAHARRRRRALGAAAGVGFLEVGRRRASSLMRSGCGQRGRGASVFGKICVSEFLGLRTTFYSSTYKIEI